MRWVLILLLSTTVLDVDGQFTRFHPGIWRERLPALGDYVPDDGNQSWPSPDVVFDLGKRLKGDVYLPRSASYVLGTINQGNTRFNSRFGAVVMAETTCKLLNSTIIKK